MRGAWAGVLRSGSTQAPLHALSAVASVLDPTAIRALIR